MSSTTSKPNPRERTATAQTMDNPRALSLTNEDSKRPRDLQPIVNDSSSKKSIEKLPSYVVWSVFNLILVPFGVLCCYFSYRVRQSKIQAVYEKALLWSKRTLILNIITTLIMFGMAITIAMLRYDIDQRSNEREANQTRTTLPFIPWQPGR
jgi:hypothetical protein